MTSPAEEAERRRQMRGMEAFARRQPDPAPGEPNPDPVHALRTRLDGTAPDVRTYVVCRWSLAARLISDAAEAGAGRVTDLGVLAPWLTAPRSVLVTVGVHDGRRWLAIAEGLEQLAEAVLDMDRRQS